MIKNKLLLFFGVIFFFSFSKSPEFSQWRGPGRDGIYPEKGLLKEWPDGGPSMLWSYDGLGAGHSSVGIGDGKIFITGMPDTTGILYSFDLKGTLLWKKEYGLEWKTNYTGPRSTPTVVDQLVYLESGQGVVYCFEANSGDIKWSVDLLKKFDAGNIQWGMAESLLIDGNRIICTPGGKDNNVVALNRFTGETIWTSKGFGEPAAYCSPVLVNHDKTRLIVTMTATSVIGIDAETGELYWRVEQQQTNKIHANTPVYANGMIYCSSAYGDKNSGILALKLSADGKHAEQAWRNEKYQNLMGGIIIKDGTIYGSAYKKNNWYSLNSTTGQEKLISGDFGGGVILYADGMFYCYSEKGQLGLVDMNPDGFTIKGKFDVSFGTGEHWAHPVIHDRRLYLRHGNSLMAFHIAEK
ncbi:MAG TPA: alcohol dehydrogenase [Prolixibacteraceae bacterium]|nr:alcohol dehydrogenase [Prolixibacteraceae bacterium]